MLRAQMTFTVSKGVLVCKWHALARSTPVLEVPTSMWTRFAASSRPDSCSPLEGLLVSPRQKYTDRSSKSPKSCVARSDGWCAWLQAPSSGPLTRGWSLLCRSLSNSKGTNAPRFAWKHNYAEVRSCPFCLGEIDGLCIYVKPQNQQNWFSLGSLNCTPQIKCDVQGGAP